LPRFATVGVWTTLWRAGGEVSKNGEFLSIFTNLEPAP
jgi:hypothetical protein